MSEFTRIVNVIPLTRVSLRGAQIFTYLVPLKLTDQIRPGQIVKVPFGGRLIFGIISSFEMHRLPKETKGLKTVDSLVQASPVVSEKNLALAAWLSNYYVTPLGMALKAMLPNFSGKPKIWETSGYERFNPDFVLTEYQRHAVAQIGNSLGKNAIFLLHGVTGSGKTEVYMQIVERVLESEKQVIILVPEISLTAQAIERFAKRFGIEKIALMSSSLKQAEKQYLWQVIQRGEKQIVIGPRSAVFAPVRNLGVVIMDEEHDSSFKQYGQNPKYHARKVAEKLCQLWNCPLILGDATPSVETYERAVVDGGHGSHLLELPHRIKADLGLPRVNVIDMRREQASGGLSVFSEALKFAILENLRWKKQIILFVNRRGGATFVLCRDCGFVQTCNDCEVPLVWHLSTHKLVCHHCGRNYELPAECPVCKSVTIKFFGLGTQLVEQQLKQFLRKEMASKDLPAIARMDRDTTLKSGLSDKFYQDWVAGKIRILIGTQIVTKGWDVAAVGLVGIISADTILHLPDFRSNERTFQILTQVAGRTGRGNDAGTVILQTYNPDNFAIRTAKLHDYEGFFHEEIVNREKFGYPPFKRLVKLTISHKDEQTAREQAMETRRGLLARRNVVMDMLGPVPAFIPKLRGKYQYQIILKFDPDIEANLYDYIKEVPKGIDIEVDPESLL